MYAERHVVTVVTDADGAATAYTSVPVTGRLLSIQYVKDGTAPYTDGVDFVVTGNITGLVLWDEDNVNASCLRAPRQPTHDNLGVASLHAAGGEPVEDHYVLANEQIKIVIAAGGATKTGTFNITIG